jgi:hypothetical protein
MVIADYFGALPNLAARVMGSAAYGQTLLEASTKLPINWTVPFPALPLDPGGAVPSPGRLRLCPPAPIAADGYVDIKVLGRFTLKGVPGLAVLADALPRRLRKRSFAMPGGLVEPCPHDGIPNQSVSAGAKLHAKASPFSRQSSPPGSPNLSFQPRSSRQFSLAALSDIRQVSVSHTFRTANMGRRFSQMTFEGRKRPSIGVVSECAESAASSPAHEHI